MTCLGYTNKSKLLTLFYSLLSGSPYRGVLFLRLHLALTSHTHSKAVREWESMYCRDESQPEPLPTLALPSRCSQPPMEPDFSSHWRQVEKLFLGNTRGAKLFLTRGFVESPDRSRELLRVFLFPGGRTRQRRVWRGEASGATSKVPPRRSSNLW